ncbi:AraC family transcriptional regulator [bacterium]|nr:MAG: AraC family transcriptional regulator [bacterium]
MPCPHALASIKVPGKRWRTRVERLALLQSVRDRILAGGRDDLTKMGDEVGLSPYHLQRLFTAAFGESPKAMVDRLRAERAAEMLRQGAKPIEVVVSLRYTELSAFSRDFKRHHGVSPRMFCKNCQPASNKPKAD